MQLVFNIIATIIFLALYIVWSKRTGLDVFMKIILFLMFLVGVVLLLNNYGYLVFNSTVEVSAK